MVMIGGVVGNNNTRKLDTEEFRGFALSDDIAPLIFVNGADAKSAQMFTLAHELAHIWLGKSALSDASLTCNSSNKVETWCNKTAAEFLVPLEMLKKESLGKRPLDKIDGLTKTYKVSSLVIIRRLLDGNIIGKRAFNEAWNKESARLNKKKKSSGGDFYRTMDVRTGKRFSSELIASAFEGKTSFMEALRLLDIKKMDIMREMGRRLEVLL